MKKQEFINYISNFEKEYGYVNAYILGDIADIEIIEIGIEVEKHRYYETSISVLKLEDGLIGIRTLSDLFSEQMNWTDTYESPRFHEVESKEVVTTIYKFKEI